MRKPIIVINSIFNLYQVFERVFLGGKKTYHTKHSRERIEEHLWDRFHFPYLYIMRIIDVICQLWSFLFAPLTCPRTSKGRDTPQNREK